MAVGFKPAGGIRTAKQSIDWLAMMKEELGDSWLRAEMFRFGASGLLGDIERQLEHYVTGRYSAEYRHPMRKCTKTCHEHRRKIRQHGVRPRPRRSQGCGNLARPS